MIYQISTLLALALASSSLVSVQASGLGCMTDEDMTKNGWTYKDIGGIFGSQYCDPDGNVFKDGHTRPTYADATEWRLRKQENEASRKERERSFQEATYVPSPDELPDGWIAHGTPHGVIYTNEERGIYASTERPTEESELAWKELEQMREEARKEERMLESLADGWEERKFTDGTIYWELTKYKLPNGTYVKPEVEIITYARPDNSSQKNLPPMWVYVIRGFLPVWIHLNGSEVYNYEDMKRKDRQNGSMKQSVTGAERLKKSEACGGSKQQLGPLSLMNQDQLDIHHRLEDDRKKKEDDEKYNEDMIKHTKTITPEIEGLEAALFHMWKNKELFIVNLCASLERFRREGKIPKQVSQEAFEKKIKNIKQAPHVLGALKRSLKLCHSNGMKKLTDSKQEAYCFALTQMLIKLRDRIKRELLARKK